MPSDPGETLKRAKACLLSYFDPAETPDEKAAVLQNFVAALDATPQWAMHAAFDEWARTQTRRPCPAEIVILARKAMTPIRDELLDRKSAAGEDRRAALQRRAEMPSKDEAAAICAAAGFTPQRVEAIRKAPQAGSFARAEADASKPATPHWTEVTPADDPAWRTLQAARANNPIMAAAIAARADKGTDA